MSGSELKRLIASINESLRRDITIMEVCGTHTQAIAKAGFSELLDSRIRLISGPGCPVCVTAEGYIDAAIELLQQPNVMLVTFGDMIRVKGSRKSLEDCMEMKNRVKIVYSPFAALDIAGQHPDSQIVFLAVGFETTAPLIGAMVKLTQQRGMKNLFFLIGLKLMPPVLKRVLSSLNSTLDALICPGHVSVIMGSEYFRFVADSYYMPAVISGFEYEDVAAAIYCLCEMMDNNEKRLVNLYPRCVRPQGNVTAKSVLEEVFQSRDGFWRGIGRIEASELTLTKPYERFDAARNFDIDIKQEEAAGRCRCGDIITGSKSPFQCGMFGRSCTPEEPKGPCMVSSEGACAIYYKFKRSGA